MSSWLLLLASAALAFGCQESRPPNLLIVVVDTLRADRLGSAGNPSGLTPFLDELATRSVRFDNAFAASSWTVPSVASLFTSRFPTQHRVTAFESRLADEEVTLAERLFALGFRSAGFTANPRLTENYGYGQGFDLWQVVEGDRKVRGPAVRAACLAWLDRVVEEDPDTPIALYVHFMEPHAPYQPPRQHRRQRARIAGDRAVRTANRKLIADVFGLTVTKPELELLFQLYDGEVAAADDQVRALFGALGERGFLADAVVAVTADHGEEFREHGVVVHGRTLYDPGLQVPLLLSWPDGPLGTVVPEPVSLVDLAPTLLSLVGADADRSFEGRSLLPLALGDGPARPVLAELVPTSETDAMMRNHEAAWIDGRWKLMVGRSGKTELYDREDDELEAENTPPGAPLDSLTRQLAKRRAELRERANDAESTAPLDEAARERLRELGYFID